MNDYLTETNFLVGGLGLLLVIIFALAAFLDVYWKGAAPPRGLNLELGSSFLPQGPDSDEDAPGNGTLEVSMPEGSKPPSNKQHSPA